MTLTPHPFGLFNTGGAAAAAIPTCVGAPIETSLGTPGTQMTVDVGTPTAGNLLVAWAAGDYDGSGESLTTSTTGWTRVANAGTGSVDCYMSIFWKEAVGSDADLVVDATNSQQMCAMVCEIQDSDVTQPFVDVSIGNQGISSNTVIEGGWIRTYLPNVLILASIAGDGSNTAPWVVSDGSADRGWVYGGDVQSVASSENGVALGLAKCPVETMDPHMWNPHLGWIQNVADGGTKGMLTVRPATSAPEDNNLLYYSRNLVETKDHSGGGADIWIHINTTATYDQTGIDDVANHATKISDNNTSSVAYHLCPWMKGGYPPYDTDTWVLRVFVKKEVTATTVPAIQFGFHTDDYQRGGTFIILQVETELGTLHLQTGSGSYYIQSYDSDWWEIGIEKTSPDVETYAQAIIYPAYAATYTGSPSNTPTGDVVIGNVELYHNISKEDVQGLAPRYKEPEQPSGYLIYDNFFGHQMHLIRGSVPAVTPTGSEAWLEPTTIPDNFEYARGPHIDTDSADDLTVIHAGQTDFTVGLDFIHCHDSDMMGALGCRFDSTGENGYIVGVINTQSTPEIHIHKITSSSVGSSLASTTAAAAGGDIVDYRIEVDCDSAGIYGRMIIDGVTETVQYLSSDLNTNEYAALFMNGDSIFYGKGPFTVEDF